MQWRSRCPGHSCTVEHDDHRCRWTWSRNFRNNWKHFLGGALQRLLAHYCFRGRIIAIVGLCGRWYLRDLNLVAGVSSHGEHRWLLDVLVGLLSKLILIGCFRLLYDYVSSKRARLINFLVQLGRDWLLPLFPHLTNWYIHIPSLNRWEGRALAQQRRESYGPFVLLLLSWDHKRRRRKWVRHEFCRQSQTRAVFLLLFKGRTMLLLLLMCILLSNCGQILVWEICRVSRCYLLILCHHGRLLETEQARLAWSPLVGLRDGRACALQEAIERVNIFYILYLVKRWRGRTMIWNEHGV